VKKTSTSDVLAAAAESMLEGYANSCPDKNAEDADIRAEHNGASCRYCVLERAVAAYREAHPQETTAERLRRFRSGIRPTRA